VHVHENGDEYHKHIVDDPVKAAYVPPPVVHHVEPAYVAPVAVKPIVVSKPVIVPIPEPAYVAPVASKIKIVDPKPVHLA